MTSALIVVLCLALPWLWGAVVAAVYARRDRRRLAAAAEPPPPEYTI
jgi:hypothetical protein